MLDFLFCFDFFLLISKWFNLWINSNLNISGTRHKIVYLWKFFCYVENMYEQKTKTPTKVLATEHNCKDINHTCCMLTKIILLILHFFQHEQQTQQIYDKRNNSISCVFASWFHQICCLWCCIWLHLKKCNE